MRIACIQTPAFALSQAAAAARYLLDTVESALSTTPAPDLVLLPEVAYPAYYLAEAPGLQQLDGYLSRVGAPTLEEFAAQLSRLAARHGAYVAAGLALAGPGTSFQNAMVLYDRGGQEVTRVGKQFLWHFDGCWFDQGAPPPVVAVDEIPVGLFICCDGRAPEIPRRLAVAGAQLFLDSTNWVTSGRDSANLPNAQPDYMMRVRAMENGCWFAAANKVGREADSIVYCGKSCIIAPDGRVVAMASTDRPEVLVAEIPEGPEGLLGAGNGGLTARRPGKYHRLSAARPAPLPDPSPAPAPYVAVVQVSDGDSDIARLLGDLRIHGAQIAVLPEGEQPLSHWQAATRSADLWVLATGVEDGQKIAWLLRRGEVLGRSAKGHIGRADAANGLKAGHAEPALFETPFGRIGVVIGEDGLVPEVVRGLALAGADIIAWPHRLTEAWQEAFVRTRAAENRVFVAAAGRAVPGGEAMIADPAGIVLARTFPGGPSGCGCHLHPCGGAAQGDRSRDQCNGGSALPGTRLDRF